MDMNGTQTYSHKRGKQNRAKAALIKSCHLDSVKFKLNIICREKKNKYWL